MINRQESIASGASAYQALNKGRQPLGRKQSPLKDYESTLEQKRRQNPEQHDPGWKPKAQPQIKPKRPTPAGRYDVDSQLNSDADNITPAD